MTRYLPVLLLLASCTQADPVPQETGTDGTEAVDPCAGVTPEVTNLSAEELATMLPSKDFELVNVHIPYAGEIQGTDAHIPYTDTDALEAHLGHDKAARIVVYCLTGPMSAIASANLVDRGYCNVYDLPSGMATWQAMGFPMGDGSGAQ